MVGIKMIIYWDGVKNVPLKNVNDILSFGGIVFLYFLREFGAFTPVFWGCVTRKTVTLTLKM